MYKKFWNEEMETLSTTHQRKLEEMELKKQLEYVYSNSSFYQRKFSEAGISPKKITGTIWQQKKRRSLGCIAQQAALERPFILP
jgi:hypothetical protein